MTHWFHRNPLKATAPVSFSLYGVAASTGANKICNDLKSARARLLELLTDVTANAEMMKNATDAYFSLLQGFILSLDGIAQENKLHFIQNFKWTDTLQGNTPRLFGVTEKQLGERVLQLFEEKCEVLEKISELKQKIKESEQQLVESEKTKSSSAHENEKLQEAFKALQKNNENLMEKLRTLQSAVEEERRKNLHQEERLSDTQKSFKKLQSLINSKSAELSKVQTCLEEARLKEAAVKAELQSVLKENNTLKDSNKNLLKEARSWEEQYRELSEQMKTLQKSQKDSEDTIARKDNEIKVLSDCITELRQLETEAKCETVELQKGDAKSNEETQGKKNDAMKNKIKQMMDIKTTLTIVEGERDRYKAKLLAEENSRHQLEEQIQKLEHGHASLKSEKSHLEIEFKTMEQKLDIMDKLYQQKENALQQKLTQEEYERREKEQKLSEVDSKAVQAREELKIYKQRIQEIGEELQKTDRFYKIQIASYEKKAHENWLNARAAERTLVEEKRETSNLRQ
ncbi:transport and Golgi organization protein 1 homolog, partial [Polyodon spathula]|uniref:transport and Golgi organization protein 1 homolog n=1 Tax=Polyodon spathula TaxID=7913 RepID=UPI001B7DB185